MLKVTIYQAEPASDEYEARLTEALDETVDFVSYFNGGTHGPPALVAPGRQDGRQVDPRARPGDTVLYVNTALIPALKIERMEDQDR